jgi:hypothetical protein
MKNMSKIAVLILFLLWTSHAMAADVTTFHLGAAERQLSSATDEVANGYYGPTTLHNVDNDLAAGNIKKPVNIFGIIGTYEGAGGTSYVIPKTSQTALYVTDYPTAGSTEGCDGWYQKGTARSFTVSAPGPVNEEVVTDNITGLMWVRDANGRGCNYYGGILTWEAAIAFCENLSFAGYSDWRLPNVRELQSIVDYGSSGPPINLTYFPNTYPVGYWSSTTFTPNTGNAWIVFFYNGDVLSEIKDSAYNVRPVRGGQ